MVNDWEKEMAFVFSNTIIEPSTLVDVTLFAARVLFDGFPVTAPAMTTTSWLLMELTPEPASAATLFRPAEL